jgi:hypothetical protein
MAIGALEELQNLLKEFTAYLSDTGQPYLYHAEFNDLNDQIRRNRVGLLNMDYERWLMLALNRPGICFYLQGIRTCGQ